MLSILFRIIHSFAPSSANVEQVFSLIKLVKSKVRNRLKEETLESLMLLEEEFRHEKAIYVDEKLIYLFDIMRQKFNRSKSEEGNSTIVDAESVGTGTNSERNGVLNNTSNVMAVEVHEQASLDSQIEQTSVAATVNAAEKSELNLDDLRENVSEVYKEEIEDKEVDNAMHKLSQNIKSNLSLNYPEGSSIVKKYQNMGVKKQPDIIQLELSQLEVTNEYISPTSNNLKNCKKNKTIN